MAEWARRIEGEIIDSDRAGETILLFRQPIGVIGGILPWNFPFFLIARKAAPALVTGNTIVIKPSEETPHNAVQVLRTAGANRPAAGRHQRGPWPRRARRQSAGLIADIGMISFTGSVETGSRIMAAAAQNITKVNLELGGKAPAIVMARRRSGPGGQAPSRLRASSTAARSAIAPSASTCIARVADKFTEKLARGDAGDHASATRWRDADRRHTDR